MVHIHGLADDAAILVKTQNGVETRAVSVDEVLILLLVIVSVVVFNFVVGGGELSC